VYPTKDTGFEDSLAVRLEGLATHARRGKQAVKMNRGRLLIMANTSGGGNYFLLVMWKKCSVRAAADRAGKRQDFTRPAQSIRAHALGFARRWRANSDHVYDGGNYEDTACQHQDFGEVEARNN